MERLRLGRPVVGALVALGMLAGCGGNGATASVPPAITSNTAHHATSSALVYAVTDKAVVMLSYPGGGEVGTIPYHRSGQGTICSDPDTGSVFLPVGFDSAESKIYEYAPGTTMLLNTLSVPAGYSEPDGCAIDPTTGNLAVVVDFVGSGIPGAVLVYSHAEGTPTIYSATKNITWFGYPAYDGSGNLYVSVGDKRGGISIAELPFGATRFIVNAFTNCTCTPIKLQWDGTYLTSEDTASSGTTVVEQIAINGSGATLVDTIPLTDARDSHYFWIYKGSVLANLPKNRLHENIGIWAYPAGGNPTAKFNPRAKKKDYLLDITVSVAPTRPRIHK